MVSCFPPFSLDKSRSSPAISALSNRMTLASFRLNDRKSTFPYHTIRPSIIAYLCCNPSKQAIETPAFFSVARASTFSSAISVASLASIPVWTQMETPKILSVAGRATIFVSAYGAYVDRREEYRAPHL